MMLDPIKRIREEAQRGRMMPNQNKKIREAAPNKAQPR
jgi:hypothetical protein